MTARLPDVAVQGCAPASGRLDGVGMQGIDLPVLLDEPGLTHPVHARVDVRVDLPQSQVKGIHMSRLYLLLQAFAVNGPVRPLSLALLLEQMVASQADCHVTQAQLAINFDLLRFRPALVTESLGGWKSYPVRVEALWQGGTFHVETEVTVPYSSTCPCSAALSRQVVQDAFVSSFGAAATASVAEVADWLMANASIATPHSQRSLAQVRVHIPSTASSLGLTDLIDLVEAAVGTPVQTAVKRADEQAFAKLNGTNLMYVEDAARRIQSALADRYRIFNVGVRHLESLHPHDAVAYASHQGLIAMNSEDSEAVSPP